MVIGENGIVYISRFISILYLKGVSKEVRRTLSGCDIHTIFRYFNTLRQQFSHPKDHTPLMMRSRVVYSVRCKDCDFSHIDETSVHLHTRVNTHKHAVQKGELKGFAVAQHA